MSLFSKNSPQDAAFRQNETRLTRLRDTPGLSTSNFSVNELALCAPLGIRPLGQVISNTVFQMASQSPPYRSGEMTYMTKAMQSVRQLVFSRLQQEAEMIGAQGIVGVHLEQTLLQPDTGLTEWKAAGTAVHVESAQREAKPFLCGLSCQGLLALKAAGYRPVGLAWGVCGYYQRGDRRFETAAFRAPYSMGTEQNQPYSIRDNREDSGLTAGVYAARFRAMQRLETEAILVEADGIIGLQWEMTKELREECDLSDTFRKDAYLSVSVLGTAIAALGSGTTVIDYALSLTS